MGQEDIATGDNGYDWERRVFTGVHYPSKSYWDIFLHVSIHDVLADEEVYETVTPKEETVWLKGGNPLAERRSPINPLDTSEYRIPGDCDHA